MSAALIIKRIIVVAILAMLPIVLAVGWFLVRGPGAYIEAKRFGHSVRAAISDADLQAWAEKIASSRHAGGETAVEIPRTDWPPQLAKLLEENPWANATLYRDQSGLPSGIRFRHGIVGIVIPLHGTIPATGYFSIHMIAPDCPYYAYSIYR